MRLESLSLPGAIGNVGVEGLAPKKPGHGCKYLCGVVFWRAGSAFGGVLTRIKHALTPIKYALTPIKHALITIVWSLDRL